MIHKRYLIIAVFILLTAGLIAGGVLFTQSINQRHANDLASTQKKIDGIEGAVVNGRLKIAEAGWQMKVDEDLQDLIYFYRPSTRTAYFSTRRLMSEAFGVVVNSNSTDNQCSPADFPIGAIQFGKGRQGGEHIRLGQQIDGFDFHLLKSRQAYCSDNPEIRGLQDFLRIKLQQSFNTITTYRDLNFKTPAAPAGNFGSPF